MINCSKEQLSLGIISDTHGLFRPKIVDLFDGVDYIIHAGDIGTPQIINKLSEIAPVLAVLGNTDSVIIFPEYLDKEFFVTPYIKMYVLHNLDSLDLNSRTAGFNVVISGHTHRAAQFNKNSTLYLNPGSAGPQRSNIPISVARLYSNGPKLHAEIFEIE